MASSFFDLRVRLHRWQKHRRTVDLHSRDVLFHLMYLLIQVCSPTFMSMYLRTPSRRLDSTKQTMATRSLHPMTVSFVGGIHYPIGKVVKL